MSDRAMITSSEQAPILPRDDDYRGLTLVVSPAEALARMQELQAFVRTVMAPGIDYGSIPGTEKPTLFQPGAQKLAEVYGFAHRFEDVTVTEDWDRPFFMYRKRCVLTLRRDGRYIGDGIGSCNSREDRYAWRWVFANEVPSGVDREKLKAKEFASKRSGTTYVKYRVPNEDICSLVNTIEKMACKRSYIHAVISVTRSAGVFTQDLEDLPESAYGIADDSRSWEHEKTADLPSERMHPKVAELLAALEAATDDESCKAVGRAMIGAKKTREISEAQADAIQAAIRNKRRRIADAAAPARAVDHGDEASQ